MTSHLLFLIGYRGSGKTTVAAILAERLGWNWLDADHVLETRAGRSIRQIFAEEGEAAFRALEARHLLEFCRLREHVVATGGGVVLDALNREKMRSAGKVVWLIADVDTLLRRLAADATTSERRPALTVGGRAEIEELLRVREPLYQACADWTVETRDRSPEDVADAIGGWLARAS